jgi:hypothetical protein
MNKCKAYLMKLTLALLVSTIIFRFLFSYTLIDIFPGFRKHKPSEVYYFPLVVFNPFKENFLYGKLSDLSDQKKLNLDLNNYQLISMVEKTDLDHIGSEYHLLFWCNKNDGYCYDSIVVVFNDNSNVPIYAY